MSKCIYILNITIGVVFLGSALSKIISIDAFIDIVNQFSDYWNWCLSYITIQYIAYAIIVIETILSILLIFNIKPIISLSASLMLLMSFTTLTAINYLDEYTPIRSCGCFGEILEFSPSGTLLKNIVLLLISITAFILHYRRTQ